MTNIRPFNVTHRLVLSIAVPMTLAYLTTPILGIVDTAVVGRFGDAALIGGLAAGAVCLDVFFTGFNFLRASTTGLVAQAFGRGDQAQEQAIFWRSVVVALVCGFALMAIAPIISDVGVWFMDAGDGVSKAMSTYIVIRSLGAPITLMNYTLLGYILGRGEGMLGLGLQGVLNGANIILSIALGLWFGWGLEGVAWASIIAEAIACVLGFCVVIARFSKQPRLNLNDVFQGNAFKRVLSLNRDVLIRSVVLVSSFTLFTKASALLGEVPLAANALLMHFFMVAGFFLDGFATAAEQLTGRAIGAHYQPALRRVVKLTSFWGCALAIFLSSVFLIFGTDLIAAMTNVTPVINYATYYLPYGALCALSGVLAFQMDGVFIGATWSSDMRNMMLVSFVLYVAALASLSNLFGNHGIWLALHLFLIARGISLFLILPRRIKQTFACS